MLAAEGVNVHAIMFSLVKEGAARLRFILSCVRTEEQIRTAVELTVGTGADRR